MDVSIAKLKKHAFLIMAHHNLEQVMLLIECIDSCQHDIFLHVDKKYKEFDADAFRRRLKYSNLVVIAPMNVVWGDYSQIECELNLIQAAVDTQYYEYIHLISGEDFLIKRIDYIYNFFHDRYPAEFVDYLPDNDRVEAERRCREYHFFQGYVGKNRKKDNFFWNIECKLLWIQRFLKINRCKNIREVLGKGANWFSITGDFAKYICSEKKFVKKHFKKTICCDEVFLQTLLNKSQFKENLFICSHDGIAGNLVYTDWERGNPYTFTQEDFNDLIQSPCCFARKVSVNVDPVLVELLVKYSRGDKR